MHWNLLGLLLNESCVSKDIICNKGGLKLFGTISSREFICYKFYQFPSNLMRYSRLTVKVNCFYTFYMFSNTSRFL